MTIFQLSALGVLAVLSFVSIRNILRRRGRLRISLLWLGMWAVAAVLVARPGLAMLAARFAGIGRGADLVFYCNVLFTMSGLFYLYLKNRGMQRQITLLVRELAIASATEPAAAGSHEPNPVEP